MKETSMKEQMQDHEAGVLKGHIRVEFLASFKDKGADNDGLDTQVDFHATQQMQDLLIQILMVKQADGDMAKLLEYGSRMVSDAMRKMKNDSLKPQ